MEAPFISLESDEMVLFVIKSVWVRREKQEISVLCRTIELQLLVQRK